MSSAEKSPTAVEEAWDASLLRVYHNDTALNPPRNTSWGELLELVPTGARILDVGCAAGAFSLALREKRGAVVIGVEYNPEAAALARSRCHSVIEGDIEKLIAENALHDLGPFDVIIFADVLEHLPRPQWVLKNLKSLLRPQGAFLVSLPNVTHSAVMFEMLRGRFPRREDGLLDRTHLHFFGRRDVIELFRGADCAARIESTVNLAPQHTEFKIPLEEFSTEVIDALNTHRDASVYQFIVRAIPYEWASATNFEAPDLTAGTQSIRENLAQAVRELNQKLSEYHYALESSQAENARLHGELEKYHHALESLRNEHLRSELLLAQQSELQSQKIRTLSAERTQRQKRDNILLGSFLRAVPSPERAKERLRVLFVTENTDAPFRYRCETLARLLRREGTLCNVLHINSPHLMDSLAGYSVIILFRLRWSDAVSRLMHAAREHHISVGFDIDDLVFLPEHRSQLYFLHGSDELTQRPYACTIEALHRTFVVCDFFTGSTETLAAAAFRAGKPAFVMPNLLHPHTELLSTGFSRIRSWVGRGSLLSYLSGSSTHDLDLLSIEPALTQVLEKRPDVKLVVAGYADARGLTKLFPDQVVRLPAVHWRALGALQCMSSLNLAPLAVINEFSDAKSALKWFEAAIVGVPTIASPTAPMKEAILDGETGLLAHDQEQWTEGILRLLDPKEGKRIGTAARRAAKNRNTVRAFQGEMSTFLSRFVSPDWVPRQQPKLRNLDGESVRNFEDQSLRARFIGWRESLRAAGALVKGARDLPELSRRLSEQINRFALSFTFLDPPVAELLAGRSLTPVFDVTTQDLSHCELSGDVVASGNDVRSVGADPWVVFPEFPRAISPQHYRFILIRMSAETSEECVFAQLYWRGSTVPYFSEDRAARFEVVADGRMRSYLVDLWSSNIATALLDEWREEDEVTHFRLDPLCSEGRFSLDSVNLVPLSISAEPEWNAVLGLPDPVSELVAHFARGHGIQLPSSYPSFQAHPIATTSLSETIDGAPNFIIAREQSEESVSSLLQSASSVLPKGGICLISTVGSTELCDAFCRTAQAACVPAFRIEVTHRVRLQRENPTSSEQVVILRKIRADMDKR